MLTTLISSAQGLTEVTQLSSYGNGTVGVTLSNGNYVWPYYSLHNSGAYIRINQIDASGNISQWSSTSLTTVGGSGNLLIYNLLKDQAGSIYLVGSSSARFEGFTLAESQGIFVAKYGPDGTRQWINPSSYGGYDPGSTIDKDGNVVLAMQGGDYQFTVKKISSSGSTSWVTNFEGVPASNYGGGVAVSTDISGNVLVVHSAGDGANRDDVLITRLNSAGSITSSQSFSAGVDIINMYGATLAGFDIGTFVATTTGGTFVFTVNAQGSLEDSYLYSDDGSFALSSISVGVGNVLYVGGDDCGYYDDCLQRIIKFEGTSLVWDAYFDSTYLDSGAVVKEVHGLSVDIDGSLTYSFRQGWPSNNVYRDTFPAPVAPQVLTSTASLSAANATITGSIDVGNLKTSVACMISETSDFQTYLTVSAGAHLIADGTYQCQPTNLQLGTTYFYKTVAVNSIGTSTSPVKMVTIPNVPSTPSLQGSLTGRTALLSFAKPNDNGMPLQNFTLQRKFDSGSWSNLVVLTPTAESTQTYSDVISQSDAGKVATYQVSATNSVGNSVYSNQVSLTLPTVPLAPTALTAVGGKTDIIISWSDPANIVTSGPLTYLYQITNNGITWSDFTPSSNPSARSAVFDSAIGGSSYRFRVKAVNAFGESSWSTSSNLSQLAASYILTYIYGDATSGDSIAEANYTEGESGVDLPNPTRTGYTFAGWFNNPTFTGKAIVSPYAPTDSHSLYAKWTKNPVRASASAKPTISGTAKVSKTLTAKKGTWTGYPAPTISYQWYACSSSILTPKSAVPTSCKKISGATKTSFKIMSAQKGKYVAVLVTGSSAGTTKTLWLSKSTSKVS